MLYNFEKNKPIIVQCQYNEWSMVERKRAKERNLCNKKIEAEKKQKFFIILCSDKRLQKQR